MINANIQQVKDNLKTSTSKVGDGEQQLELSRKLFNANKEKLNNEIEEIKKLQDMYNQRL